jgi:hypothetical protein
VVLHPPASQCADLAIGPVSTICEQQQAGYALSYSLAHLAVPYGGRQDARLEPKYIQSVNISNDASSLYSYLAGLTLTIADPQW